MKKLILLFTVFLIAFLIGLKISEAHTVTMTTSVGYNNCNLTTSHMPVPEIIHTYPNEYGYNFVALVGSSTLFSIWEDENTLNFYLDEARWSVVGGKYVAGECVYN